MALHLAHALHGATYKLSLLEERSLDLGFAHFLFSVPLVVLRCMLRSMLAKRIFTGGSARTHPEPAAMNRDTPHRMSGLVLYRSLR